MKLKKVFRTCVDMATLVILVLLMTSNRTGIMLHVLLDVVLFVLLVIHNALNASWWGSVDRGQYSRGRWIQTVLNFSLLADILVILISGMAYAVTLHRFAALLYVIMMSLFMANRWPAFRLCLSDSNVPQAFPARDLFYIIVGCLLLSQQRKPGRNTMASAAFLCAVLPARRELPGRFRPGGGVLKGS